MDMLKPLNVGTINNEIFIIKYKRRFKVHKKYKAHDPAQEYHVGDKVVIEESKPISKDKNWIVIKKI